MAGEFWLSEAQWGAIEPLLPKNQPGARRADDRRVLSGIVHVLKTGCRWQDCPSVYGPPTTIYNRFRRWTMRGLWRRLFEALARAEPGDGQAIDSTTAKAHRSAAGGKGGPRRRRLVARAAAARRKSTPSPMRADAHRHRSDARPSRRCSGCDSLDQRCSAGRELAADAAYDSDGLRRFLRERGTIPIIPNNPTRKKHHPLDEVAYRQRNLIERMFCRLKDWRRIATRYDKLAATFAAAIMLAAVVIWWT